MPDFIGYDQAERMVTSLLDRAASWQPECVAAITRGGLVPGTIAACLLALPLAILGFERQTGRVRWIGDPPEARRVLLVDDCCATGATMRAARFALLDEGRAVLTLTIVHDPETTGFLPDLSHPMRALFRLPWERGEATPAARALRATGAAADRATERPFQGLDLDGVFLTDIARAEYEADLPATLARRAALELLSSLPHFTPDRAVIVTGRPEMDREATIAWLARHGHAALPVVCRPDHLPNDPATVAGYKAEAATRWGCTHFVESDPEQAILIAAAAPHLIVSWWSATTMRAHVVSAAPGPAPVARYAAP